MTTARTVLPRLLLVQLAACLAHAVELPLLEASGAAAGLVVVAGNFTNGTNGVLLQEGKAGAAAPVVLTLSGPTPHVQGRLYPFKGGPPLAGTAAFGLTPGVPASTPSLCILQSVDKSSARKLSVAHLGSARTAEARTLSIDGAVDLAALGPNALLVLPAQSSSALIAATPFNFVSADAEEGSRSTGQPTSVSRPCLDLRGKRSARTAARASLWPCARATIHTTLCSSRRAPTRQCCATPRPCGRRSLRRSSGWRSQTCTATGRRTWS